jgi:ubiquinone/menaquinone biosynthesis C-methylase UbiE
MSKLQQTRTVQDVVRQTIQTYDKIAPEYCKKTRQPKFLEWEENYIKKLLSYISKSSPLILDVGCGDGRHCALMEKNGGKAVGIDLSRCMLEEAKAYYPDGDFRRMNMRNMLFDDDLFDGIWASGCIYHVKKSDVREVIKEFRRVLKIDGVIGLNFKLGKGEGLEDNPKSYSGFPRYFAYYTKQEMEDILKDFGFKELGSCTYPEEIFGDNIQQMWFRLKNK